MTKLERKLIYMLADPSVKDVELSKFFNKLKNGGLEIYFDKAKKIRGLMIESDSFTDNSQEDFGISVYEQKIIDQVDNLLRRNAKMTAKNAIKALSNKLQIKIPSGKSSFRDQILYLCKNTAGSVIINAAHRIHNDMIHDKNKSDWPLKEKQQ
ncbi:MAG: hypothetical protein GY795_48535 [Desulfobacterales bacterium]|nr:hypothetical protein [Desulfobacterales bacterium]